MTSTKEGGGGAVKKCNNFADKQYRFLDREGVKKSSLWTSYMEAPLRGRRSPAPFVGSASAPSSRFGSHSGFLPTNRATDRASGLARFARLNANGRNSVHPRSISHPTNSLHYTLFEKSRINIMDSSVTCAQCLSCRSNHMGEVLHPSH